jgi:hypothetical protein
MFVVWYVLGPSAITVAVIRLAAIRNEPSIFSVIEASV